MIENQITEKIIGCAIEVHRALGVGLLESAYKECLYYDLKNLGYMLKKKNQCLLSIKK
jgi:GxxExxY protein